MNRKENKKKIMIILAILLTIILIAILSFTFLKKEGKEKKAENEENKVSMKYQIPDDEDELTDELIKKEINIMLDNLNSGSIYEDENPQTQLRYYNGMSFREYLFNEEINDQMKLKIILTMNKDNFKTSTHDITKTNIDKNYKDNFTTAEEEWYELEASALNELYKKYFNENPTYYSYPNECPAYLYDDISKMYFSISPCGGTTTQSYFTYKDKMTYKDDNIYVYAYYGTVKPNSNQLGTIYKDINEEEVLKENINYKDLDDIIKKNYHYLSLYKFTFKKNNDNNYYFSNLEKIND